jgi:hypothetical protein
MPARPVYDSNLLIYFTLAAATLQRVSQHLPGKPPLRIVRPAPRLTGYRKQFVASMTATAMQ